MTRPVSLRATLRHCPRKSEPSPAPVLEHDRPRACRGATRRAGPICTGANLSQNKTVAEHCHVGYSIQTTRTGEEKDEMFQRAEHHVPFCPTLSLRTRSSRVQPGERCNHEPIHDLLSSVVSDGCEPIHELLSSVVSFATNGPSTSCYRHFCESSNANL
jgi:hypothetical protein